MNRYLADTTVLIEHLRGNKLAKLFIEENIPYISTVTIAEVIQGSKDKRDLAAALRLCGSLNEAEITGKISKRAIKFLQNYHISHGLYFLDAIIASTAIENKLILVTGNLKHFQFIKELKIIPHKEAFTV